MFSELLRARLPFLSDGQVEAMRKHYELLVKWNKILNLTSVREEEEIVERHYCESVFLVQHLPAGQFSVADIGSGAGFPGIPVAILRPEISVTLIESHQRKAVFLKEANRELPNVRVLAMRVEEVKEKFDWVTSRAVRFSDIAAEAIRIAEHVAVLGGAGLSAEFEWQQIIRLPWGKHRYLCST